MKQQQASTTSASPLSPRNQMLVFKSAESSLGRFGLFQFPSASVVYVGGGVRGHWGMNLPSEWGG
jgi:hypothetical protein